MTKVFVSGCFDVLHSGHVRFFEEAASYGDLYVSIGSDKTIQELKNRQTLYNENERLYMVSSLKFVHSAFIARGSGKLDFAEEIKEIKPDIFFVNVDGDSPEKRQFVESLGIRYVISQRTPKENLPVRSTTAIRTTLDQPKKEEPKQVPSAPSVDFNKMNYSLNRLTQKTDELYYADLLRDSTKGSMWLKDQAFSLYGWAANYSFIYLLFRILDKTNPQNILEMGLGQTTKVTSQYIAHKNPSASLTVCEHNQDWINHYKSELPQSEKIKILALGLEYFEYEGQQNDKYKDLEPLVQNQKFDLIIIDGPTGGGKNLPRSNIIDLVKGQYLANDFVIIFDDAERSGEQLTITKTKEVLKERSMEFIEFERKGLKAQHIITSKPKSFIQYL